MIARIQKSMNKQDEGFTLIELLVVIIIIGILAAIAIPTFLNQRKKATESGMKSDLRSIANEMESVYTDSQVYPAATQAAAGADVAVTGGPNVKVSDTLTVVGVTVAADNQSFCIDATNSKVDNGWKYDSAAGGLAQGAC